MPPDDASLVIQDGAGAGSELPVDGEVILGREQATADLVLEDPGVSRRHARVLPHNGGVIVEDLGSSNGTYVGGSVGPLPTTPIPQGQKQEIDADDRVYLGAWTRIVIRKASEGEF